MNLRDLKYLLAVADHQHFGRAAEKCFVSQPTLSAQLKKLEDELGVQIFERTNKKVFITPVGETLIAQARVVVREAKQLKELAALAHDPLAGRFRLGIIPTLGPYLLPHVLPALKQQMPKLELFLYEEKTTRLLQQLEKGFLDAIILALPINGHDFVSKELFTEPFLAAVPKKHGLANKKDLRVADLREENILLLEEGHCLREQALDVCQRAQAPANVSYHANSLEILRQMIASGNGISLFPALATQNKELLIKFIPLSPQPSRKIGMLWRKQSARVAACEAIAKLIKQVIKI